MNGVMHASACCTRTHMQQSDAVPNHHNHPVACVQASSLDIQIQKHVLGGASDIRSELASSTTLDDPSRIQAFLQSAQNTTAPVSYMLSKTVWDYVAGRMGNRDSDDNTVTTFNRLLATGYLANGVGEFVHCYAQ